MKEPMQRIFLVAVLSSIAASRVLAADVTWDSPVAISADSDVSTEGTLIEAVNFVAGTTPGTWGGEEVNGVPFAQEFGRNDLTQMLYNSGIWRGAGITTHFHRLMDDYAYSGTGGQGAGNWATLTLSGLTNGRRYLLQIFNSENRNGVNWQQTVRGGLNVSATVTDGGNGGGRVLNGTFVADGTTQDIEFHEISGAVWINAYQVRDITPAPADVTWATPASITSDSIVSTEGDLVEAVNFINTSTSPWNQDETVNGVTFVYEGGRDDLTQMLYNNAIWRGTGISIQFHRVMEDYAYSGTGGQGTDNWATLTLTGLHTGHDYYLQIFCCENRSGVNWQQTVRGGENVSATVTDGGNGGGKSLSGTFTATWTTQDIDFHEVAGAVWVNAYQVRRLTPLPTLFLFR